MQVSKTKFKRIINDSYSVRTIIKKGSLQGGAVNFP